MKGDEKREDKDGELRGEVQRREDEEEQTGDKCGKDTDGIL